MAINFFSCPICILISKFSFHFNNTLRSRVFSISANDKRSIYYQLEIPSKKCWVIPSNLHRSPVSSASPRGRISRSRVWRWCPTARWPLRRGRRRTCRRGRGAWCGSKEKSSSPPPTAPWSWSFHGEHPERWESDLGIEKSFYLYCVCSLIVQLMFYSGSPFIWSFGLCDQSGKDGLALLDTYSIFA